MPSVYTPVTKYEKYKSHRYYEPGNPYFTCNNILLSPFTTGLDRSRRDFKNAIIYGDSGGYQIATQGLKVSAMNILHWLENMADIGFTVDVPPHTFGDDFTNVQFMRCMRKSNDNAELMRRFKVNDDMQLWGVVLGRTLEECIICYEDLIKNHEYDGYCISLSIHKLSTEIPWIEQLRFAKTVSKRFHFLGFSDQLFTLVLAQLAKKMNLCYTFDSSTPNIGGRYGKYIHPETYKHLHITKDQTIENIPCSCPVCKNHTVNDLRRETQLINLHNLFVKINFCELANSLTDEQFHSYLDNLVRNESEKSKIIDLLE